MYEIELLGKVIRGDEVTISVQCKTSNFIVEGYV